MKFISLLFFLFFTTLSFCTSFYRNNFNISINANNQLRAENESCNIEALSELLYHYFTANMYSKYKEDARKARYINYRKTECLENIKYLENNTDSFDSKNRIKRYKRNLYVMNFLDIKTLRVLHPVEHVSIKMKSKTSYSTYIAVLSEIKKNTNRIRHQVAKKLFSISYRKIIVNQKSKLMRQYLFVLKVLVPERIAEYPVRD